MTRSSLANILGLFARTVRLIFSTAPVRTTALVVGTVVQGLVPIGRLWVAKLIIDGLIEMVSHQSADVSRVLPLVILEFLLVTGGAIAQPVGQAIQVALAALLRTRLGGAVMQVATRLDYSVLE